MESIPEEIKDLPKATNGTEKKSAKKFLPIRTHATLKDEKGELLTTMSLMKILSESKKPDGMSTSEMRSLWKGLDKAEAVHAESTVIELEPAEAKVFLDLIKSFKFGMADRFFTDFEDALL